MKWGDTLKTISEHPEVRSNREKLEAVFHASMKDPSLKLKATPEGWILYRKRKFLEPSVLDSGFWSSQEEALLDMYFGTTCPGGVGLVKAKTKPTH